MGLIAPFMGKMLYLLRISGRDGLEYRLMLKIEKLRNREIRIRVGTPHKTIANETNIKLFHCVV